MKNRILYVDYMKALAMILVIMGHVNFANDSVKAWIYSFHMPAFFFCTGLVLSFGGGAVSLKETFKNKFQRLMLPYLLWGLIYAKFSFPNLLKICYGSSWAVAASGSSSSLWFLPVMFVALMFFYVYIKIGLADKLIYNLLVMIIPFFIGCFLPHLNIGYPWGSNVAFMAFAFMMLGYIVKGYIGKLYHVIKTNKRKGALGFLFLSLLMFAGTFTYHLNNTGSIVMMKNAQYGNYGLFALTAIIGTLMLLFISMFLESLNTRVLNWLSYIGSNTLCIFVVHRPIIILFDQIFRRVHVSEFVVLPITTIGVLLISCILCMFINRHLPVLIGKNYK